MKKSSVVLLTTIAMLALGFTFQDDGWDKDSSVARILYSLGMDKPEHYRPELDPEKVRMGKEIVFTGRATKKNGLKSSYVSSYFVCTDCHNQEREDPILSESNPDTRLDYVLNKKIPFLQSTTFWGIVNRETWYNGDYVEKYGELVKPARTSLAEATQLCAKECSSGRYLKDWELEAILQYYWTLELKLGDLEMSNKEQRKLNILSHSEKDRKELIDFMRDKFMTASPATFTDMPKSLKEGYPERVTADAKRGEQLYESSCMYCHKAHGPSLLILDKDKFTLKKFRKHMTRYDDFNLYQITRHGTYAEHGHQQYMPRYTAERLSNQQVEDIRAFIEGR